MDCLVCHKESSQLRTLSETGFQTLKDAATAGGLLVKPPLPHKMQKNNVKKRV